MRSAARVCRAARSASYGEPSAALLSVWSVPSSGASAQCSADCRRRSSRRSYRPTLEETDQTQTPQPQGGGMTIVRIVNRHLDWATYDAINARVDIEHQHPLGLIMHGAAE